MAAMRTCGRCNSRKACRKTRLPRPRPAGCPGGKRLAEVDRRLQELPQQRHSDRALGLERVAVERIQRGKQRGQVAPGMPQQVIRYLRRQRETAFARTGLPRTHFLLVRQRMHLIHQAPAEAGGKVRPQGKLRRGGRTAGQQPPPFLPQPVVEVEQDDLLSLVQPIYVVRRHQVELREGFSVSDPVSTAYLDYPEAAMRGVPRGGLEQMALAAARIPPDIEAGLPVRGAQE